jgi:hypothetical protein
MKDQTESTSVPSCSACRYYHAEPGAVTGECRKNPPKIIPGLKDRNGRPNLDGHWPAVVEYDSCADFSPNHAPVEGPNPLALVPIVDPAPAENSAPAASKVLSPEIAARIAACPPEKLNYTLFTVEAFADGIPLTREVQ